MGSEAVWAKEGIAAARASSQVERQTGLRSEEFCEPGRGPWLPDYRRSVEDRARSRTEACCHAWVRRECDLEPGGHWASEAVTGSIQYQVTGDKAWSQGLA